MPRDIFSSVQISCFIKNFHSENTHVHRRIISRVLFGHSDRRETCHEANSSAEVDVDAFGGSLHTSIKFNTTTVRFILNLCVWQCSCLAAYIKTVRGLHGTLAVALTVDRRGEISLDKMSRPPLIYNPNQPQPQPQSDNPSYSDYSIQYAYKYFNV